MATMQVQKTRNAEPETETVIDQKQSLEVVQTVLHGALSSLSYLRCFFPDQAFQSQMYGMSDKIHSYEDYAAARVDERPWTVKSPKTRIHTLQRHRSKRADIFLDWLEKGAFPALHAGNLQALQVYVHAEPDDRAKIIEAYTFTIQYEQGAGKRRTPSGLQIDKPGSDLVSVQFTNQALQAMLQKLMKVCEQMPDLPVKRFLSMALFYVDNDRMNSVPSGFAPSDTDKLLFAQSDGWEKHTETLKDVMAGFHKTTLKVSHLQQTASAVTQPAAFPKEIEYTTIGSKEDCIDSAGSEAMITMSEETPTAAELTDKRAPSTIGADKAAQLAASEAPNQRLQIPNTESPPAESTISRDHGTAQTPDGPSFSRPAPSRNITASFSASQLENSLNTQSSHIAEMKSALAAMMRPEHITQGDTQPQSVAQHHQALSDNTETASRATESPAKAPENRIASSSKGSRPVLSEPRARHLQTEKANLRRSVQDLAQKAGSRTKSGQTILCQCGHAQEEGDMVQCSCCDTWQHLHCYGYTGNDDARLPAEHICYCCLLGDSEKSTFKDLGDLAVKRRGMHIVMQVGLKSQREFAEEMGLEIWKAGPVYQHMRREGYVVPTMGSHKAGFKSTGKPLYVPVRDGSNYEKMLRTLFEPMAKITHHYQLPATYDAQNPPLMQRLISSKLTDMAPPDTPASARRKQKAAATPASGLDLPPSTTAFETPTRPASRQMLTRKRSLEAEQGDDNDAKRRVTPARRLRSVQTKCVLDAGGMPSSPANAFR